jgi:hypothetical protein
MSCCGEPNDSKEGPTNRSISDTHVVNDQQPVPQPGLGTTLFQQPTISSPPLAYPNSYGQNGFQQQNPPPSLYSVSPNNTFNGSANYSLNEPLLRPSSVLQSPHRAGTASPMSMSPPVMGTSLPPMQNSSPPSDEGKMSISIDFGA